MPKPQRKPRVQDVQRVIAGSYVLVKLDSMNWTIERRDGGHIEPHYFGAFDEACEHLCTLRIDAVARTDLQSVLAAIADLKARMVSELETREMPLCDMDDPLASVPDCDIEPVKDMFLPDFLA